jgi:hypothetical protein
MDMAYNIYFFKRQVLKLDLMPNRKHKSGKFWYSKFIYSKTLLFVNIYKL